MDFHTQKVSPRAQDIFQNKHVVDQTIEKIAPEFPVEKINKVDLAILRLAIYELIVEKKAPPNVIIDEAVELAKEFGGDKSPAFINGALGKVVQHD